MESFKEGGSLGLAQVGKKQPTKVVADKDQAQLGRQKRE